MIRTIAAMTAIGTPTANGMSVCTAPPPLGIGAATIAGTKIERIINPIAIITIGMMKIGSTAITTGTMITIGRTTTMTHGTRTITIGTTMTPIEIGSIPIPMIMTTTSMIGTGKMERMEKMDTVRITGMTTAMTANPKAIATRDPAEARRTAA